MRPTYKDTKLVHIPATRLDLVRFIQPYPSHNFIEHYLAMRTDQNGLALTGFIAMPMPNEFNLLSH